MTDQTALLMAGALGAVVGAISRRGKSQPVRLLDVFAVGPLIATAGFIPQRGLPFRMALVFTGAATVTFNGGNFLDKRKVKKNGT